VGFLGSDEEWNNRMEVVSEQPQSKVPQLPRYSKQQLKSGNNTCLVWLVSHVVCLPESRSVEGFSGM
jgi:hypothetical protein